VKARFSLLKRLVADISINTPLAKWRPMPTSTKYLASVSP